MRGCTVSPDDVSLIARASAMHASQPDVGPRDGIVDPERDTHMARIEATADVSTLRFRVAGLRQRETYSLGIRYTGTACGRIAWRGPVHGLVLAGDPVPVNLQGLAIRSHLEVLGQVRPGRPRARWVGADALDLAEPDDARRMFRFSTNVPAAQSGIFQVSMRPFPLDARANPCTVSDVLHSQMVAFRRTGADAQTIEFGPIDFKALLMRRDHGGAVVPPRALEQVLAGAPLYVRVLPADSGGRPICDSDDAGVPSIVVLVNLNLDPPEPPPSPGIVFFRGKYQGPSVYGFPYYLGQSCYRAVQKHYLDPAKVQWTTFVAPEDRWGARFVSVGFKPGTFVGGAGTWDGICISHAEQSWWNDMVDSFTDFVSGYVDAVGALVNDVAGMYEDIKTKVVQVVAQAISEVPGVDCPPDSLCEEAVRAGLETGLAACGMPPSLPNFDELKEEGLDYLAAKVAEETGVPGSGQLAKEVAKKIVEQATERLSDMPKIEGLPDWLGPDIGVQPAVLVAHVVRTGAPFEARPYLHLVKSTVFAPRTVPLPRDLPAVGEAPPLQVPIVLRPNLDGLHQTVNFFGFDCIQVGSQCIPSASYDDYSLAILAKNYWQHTKFEPNPCVNLKLDWFKLEYTPPKFEAGGVLTSLNVFTQEYTDDFLGTINQCAP
jgi:hypothetical protein